MTNPESPNPPNPAQASDSLGASLQRLGQMIKPSQPSSSTEPAATASPSQPLSGNGASSAITSLAKAPPGKIGAVLGITGSLAQQSAHPNVAQLQQSLTALLPSPVQQWLRLCNDKGWMAGNGPERTNDLVEQTREAMRPLFSLWRPVAKSPAEVPNLVAEIIKTLAPFGYGALPASDLQAKLRVDGFVEVLEEYPLWAIAQAGLHWRKHNTQAPTPKELADRTRVEMGFYAPVAIDGVTLSLGSVHTRLLKWAKGEEVWG